MNSEIDITERFAEVADGPWYEWDPRVTAAIEPHIPSDRDLTQRFRARLEKQAPGTECTASKSASARYTVVDNVNYERSKRYLRVRIGTEHVFAATRLSDVVRRAYFDAADLLADTIALQVHAMRREHGRVVVSWLPSGLMHQKTGDERLRIATDPYTDTAVALIAAYYVVAPVSKEGFAP